MHPQLKNTCLYIVYHYVKMWHVRLGCANNLHPLSLGGGAQNGKDPSFLARNLIYLIGLFDLFIHDSSVLEKEPS